MGCLRIASLSPSFSSPRNGSHEGCEGRRGRYRHGGRRPIEEERILQACGCVELEAEEETSPSSSKGHQPIHQRATRLQGEASKQDRASSPDEETQGDDQLRRSLLRTHLFLGRGGRTHQTHYNCRAHVPVSEELAHSTVK